MSDMQKSTDELVREAEAKTAAALADGKKTSHNAWFWAALAVGLVIGFALGRLL